MVARFEALGLIGGLDREALHSQLASAVQVVLVVQRSSGVRRLAEIGVIVGVPPRIVTAWSVEGGAGEGWPLLQDLLRG